MKKLFPVIFVFISFFIQSQETITFFDGKTFELEYFLKNNVREELDLRNPNDPSGNTSRGIPEIRFSDKYK